MPQRDLRIDTIRGLLLVTMSLNHAHHALLYQGWIQKLTESPLGFVTGAEGFIFISGLVIGLVYSKYSWQPRQLFGKSFSRGRTIFLCHLIPLYSLHLLAFALPFLAISWERDLSFYYLAKRTLAAEALLLYQPEIFDILPMYVIFMLVAPFLFLILKKRLGWVFILFFSLFLWGLGQRFDPLCSLNNALFPWHRCGWFNIFVWQVLFVLGLILGVLKPRFVDLKIFKSYPFVIGILLATLVLFLLRHEVIDAGLWLTASVSKHNLAWLRLLNLVVLAACFGQIFTHLPLKAHLLGLAFLGQHSLQVFTFQVLLIYFITPFQGEIVAHLNGFTYPLFMLLVAASLLIPAFGHQRWRVWRARALKA